MLFLNPTILLGLLAASIPIILHFLNLRKIKKIEFSTLSFLKELQKSKIRKIKIKQLLLLLLRILIILFLVASFARPTLESNTLGAVGSKVKTTSVLILDNSFSMSVVDENGSYLNQAKEKIRNILSNFQSGDELFLILTSGSNKETETFNSFKEIEGVEISYVTKSLVNSIKAAAKIINTSKNFNKEIFIFSDFQKSTFFEKDSLEFELNITETKFYLFNFGGDQIKNFSLNGIYYSNQIFELQKEIGISTEVKPENIISETDKLISLFFDNNRVAQKNISISRNISELANFQATIDKTGLVEVLASIEEDAVEHDNYYYSHFVVPSDISLLIVTEAKENSKFIRAALSTSRKTQFNIKEIYPDEFKNVNLSSYNTIIILSPQLHKYSSQINEYIERGGNILLFPNENTAVSDLNKMLRKMNLSKAQNVISSNETNSINEFENVDFEHPIFNGLFTDSKEEIESPQIYKYLKIFASSRSRDIITLQDNSMFLSEYNLGKGKLLFFGVSPVLSWSTLPIKNIFAPLIIRSINYLNTTIESEENWYTGDEIDINISKRKTSQIKIVKPDKSFELINLSDGPGNYFKFLNSDMAGTYKFYSERELLDVKSINVNPLESNFETIPLDEFTDQIEASNNTVIGIDPSDDYLTKITTARYGSELWKLFLIIALLLALIEMYIARSAKKDLATLEN